MQPISEVYQELKKISWFAELKEEHLRKIADISTLRQVEKGDVFFHEGDKQDYVYIVTKGRVALDIQIPPHGKIRFYTAEEGDVFGWSSVTPNLHQRTATAITVIESTVIAADAAKLRQLCDEDHDLGYVVMSRMSNVIASRLMVTRLQLMDMFAEAPEREND